MRIAAPPWLEYRMNFLNPSITEQAFGSDRDWKVDRRDGKMYRFSPFTRFDVSHIEYSNVANIDDLGGRRVSVRPGTRRILPFMGDSFTFGIGVEDDETFVSQIALKLTDYRVLNLGIPGSALHKQIRIVRVRHEELGRPKRYIFFFYLGNDFADILSDFVAQDNSKNNPNSGANQSGKLYAILHAINDFAYHNPVVKQSYLVQFLRRYILKLVRTTELAGDKTSLLNPIYAIMNRDNETYHATLQRVLQIQLNNLQALQKELKFKSMIVAIPDLSQLDEDVRRNRANGYDILFDQLDPLLPNNILKSTINITNIEYFDSTPCLLKTGLGAKLYYQQDDHFRSSGHAAFATCVTKSVMSFLNSP